MAFLTDFVKVTGFLTNDVEYKETKNSYLANFSLRVRTGTKEAPSVRWMRVTAWGDLARNMEKSGLFKKGAMVTVLGALREETDESTNNVGNPIIFTRKSGEAGSSFEVRADEVHYTIAPWADTGRGPAVAKEEVAEEMPF